jgi:hypothetical protein
MPAVEEKDRHGRVLGLIAGKLVADGNLDQIGVGVTDVDRPARHGFQDFPDCIRQDEVLRVNAWLHVPRQGKANGIVVQIVRSVHGRA